MLLQTAKKWVNMDVTQTKEISALHWKKQSKFSIAKFLPQNISKIVSKDINRKHEDNQNVIEAKVITKKKKTPKKSTWGCFHLIQNWDLKP